MKKLIILSLISILVSCKNKEIYDIEKNKYTNEMLQGAWHSIGFEENNNYVDIKIHPELLVAFQFNNNIFKFVQNYNKDEKTGYFEIKDDTLVVKDLFIENCIRMVFYINSIKKDTLDITSIDGEPNIRMIFKRFEDEKAEQ